MYGDNRWMREGMLGKMFDEQQELKLQAQPDSSTCSRVRVPRPGLGSIYSTEVRPADWFVSPSKSMERLLNHYEVESLRNTMVKHEEIFRNQLNELHHLYKIQKMLMAELRSKGLKLYSLPNATSSTTTDVTTRLWSSPSVSETSHSSQVGDLPSLKELNICSKNPSRIQKAFDLERPAEEYNSTDETTATKQSILLHGKHLKGGRNTEEPHNWTEDENGIELTLSIGSGTDKDDQYVGAPSSKHQV